MAVKTYLVQLEEIQTAITQIIATGQSYTLDNRSLTRADLDKLTQREKYLLTMVNREARGGGVRTRYGTTAE